jgi:hypothetical protein
MLLLNTMQLSHRLGETQLKELFEIGITEIVHLSEIDPELYRRLSNTPSDEKEIEILASQLENFVKYNTKWSPKHGFDYFLLPIGSPAFMFKFSLQIGRTVQLEHACEVVTKFLFAHSERNVFEIEQEDGSLKKESVFNHVKFLTI